MRKARSGHFKSIQKSGDPLTGPRGWKPQRWRDTPQLTGGAAAPELRGGLIPEARSRKTPVRELLSSSLRLHKGDYVSAAAAKLREPAEMPPFQV